MRDRDVVVDLELEESMMEVEYADVVRVCLCEMLKYSWVLVTGIYI